MVLPEKKPPGEYRSSIDRALEALEPGWFMTALVKNIESIPIPVTVEALYAALDEAIKNVEKVQKIYNDEQNKVINTDASAILNYLHVRLKNIRNTFSTTGSLIVALRKLREEYRDKAAKQGEQYFPNEGNG